MIEKILVHLDKFDLDVRKSKDARFMDQKVTPDVLCIIADSVINFAADRDIEFTKDDVWNDEYFNSNVRAIFNKPDANNKTTRQEYDKFTSQPLRTLAYAGILSLRKEGNKNIYSIYNKELIEFISIKERNAYLFLYYYQNKVLSDSGFIRHFDVFKQKCLSGKVSEADLSLLKGKFQRFIIGNTRINGKIEANRIFPKILNVFSCENNIRGTIKGRLSDRQIYYTDLMYNRPNWRDTQKSKNISRNEAIAEHDDLMINQNPAYSNYVVQKAINLIRKMYRDSEIKDEWSNGEATQVHHIFPRKSFPNLAHYIENLIKLTPTQHYTKAHPGNKTELVNRDYQLICLLAKSDSIEKSLNAGSIVYRKESFVYVINTGLDSSFTQNIEFSDLKTRLVKLYNES